MKDENPIDTCTAVVNPEVGEMSSPKLRENYKNIHFHKIFGRISKNKIKVNSLKIIEFPSQNGTLDPPLVHRYSKVLRIDQNAYLTNSKSKEKWLSVQYKFQTAFTSTPNL